MNKIEKKVPTFGSEIEREYNLPAAPSVRQGVLLPLSILAAGLFITAGIFFNAALIIKHLDAKLAGTEKDTAASQQVAVQLPADTPYLGLSKAPVWVVEFADYQCPYCENFFTGVIPQLKTDYIDTGKVRFVYQDFAFLGADSAVAAEAAHCAAEQGKFWEYHDYLFSHQGRENSGWAKADKQKGFAKILGLNISQFNQCLDARKYQKAVKDETQAGRSYGVSGTPSILILRSSDPTVDLNYIAEQLGQRKSVISLPNGNSFIVGSQPYSAFRQAIDAALK